MAKTTCFLKKRVGILIIILVLGIFPLSARELSVQGSTTVFPIVQLLAEAYLESHPESRLSVGGGGSGVGISLLIDGVVDVALSSRPVLTVELERAREKGLALQEVIIGYDGLAVVVNTRNPVDSITLEDLGRIYRGEVNFWNEVGGDDLSILPIAREFASGTMVFFNQVVLGDDLMRPDVLMLTSSLSVATEVAQSPHLIAYLAFGFLNPRIKELKIDGFPPTVETIISGDYPLVRPLYLLFPGEPTGTAADFLAFIQGPAGQRIMREEGFIPNDPKGYPSE